MGVMGLGMFSHPLAYVYSLKRAIGKPITAHNTDTDFPSNPSQIVPQRHPQPVV